ncbi:unnamed protein product [Clonostachys rosea]|uniref:Zn(2)-C6 fungal-type domain-containing protein n=1 Tax=Bionectria ochroleuca TaxID=29856 RepID=A0ABY6URP9_BIOOC|nr:unnamed protein product [Clonostachys rosea]
MSPATSTVPVAASTAPASTGAESQLPYGRSRKQVSRACDWCRVRRIRCDNEQPCKACRQRGAQCTQNGGDGPRTLPQALREIDKLKARVRELESELAAHKSQPRAVAAITPVSPSDQSSPVQSVKSQVQHVAVVKPRWEGIYVATARSDQPSYYGPSSIYYFVSRIGCYLGKALQQPHADKSFQTRGGSKNMHETDTPDDHARQDSSEIVSGTDARWGALRRVHEEALLKLFWEGYHCFMPIVDEAEFRQHYASLWEPSRTTRKQSPLVDIILALCLQYGYAFIPRNATHLADHDEAYGDSAVAGRWYYRRSQALLNADLESPSLTTVQCYLFSICYLCCASFQNMCHIVHGQAVRAGQTLGLHLEPPADTPHGERELRKRVWWHVLLMETKISTKLGRPFLLELGQFSSMSRPSDDLAAATYNNSSLGAYGPGPDITWLSFSSHNIQLFFTMASIYEVLYDKCGEAIHQSNITSIYADPNVLESCAKVLAARMPILRAWADNVPEQLKMRRRSMGEPFSTDRSAIEIDPLAPMWVQRQRVWLELLYHTTALNLTRPFITFYSHSSCYTPTAEQLANIAVDHAISYTLIMHQVVFESDLLCGWNEFFFLQWSAAMTIVGFILAYPIHPATPKARQALDKAIAIFDNFAPNFPVSADAARIVRNLVSKADLLAGGAEPTKAIEAPVAPLGIVPIPDTGNSQVPTNDSLAWLDPSRQDDSVQFNQFMDWAMSVDAYNNFDNFFDASNPVDAWAFGQGAGGVQ